MSVFRNQTVIYLELDDEIITIFERIRKARYKNVVLVIPDRAQILQNLVNLKILSAKTAQLNKILIIVTKDSFGQKLAETAGLTVVPSVRDLQVQKFDSGATQLNSKTKQTKIKQRKLDLASNSRKQEAKLKKVAREEIPFGKIDLAKWRQVWQWLIQRFELRAADQEDASLVLKAPSRKFLVSLILLAFILLIFIVYIAVPTATIYITPRADPIRKVVNFNLVDGLTEVAQPAELTVIHPVRADFFEINFEGEVILGATGQIFSGQNATGQIVIFNRSAKDKFIVPSRFLSSEGIIFHTEKALVIPKAIDGQPGQIVAEVQACEQDDLKCDCINKPETCQGDFVGARGNIAAPNFFVLPAIPSLSPRLYWAESFEPMTGGETKITKFISEEDLAGIESAILREIQYQAKAETANFLAQQQQLNDLELTLLEKSGTFEVDVLDFDFAPDLLQAQQDSFVVSVKARVRGVAYLEEDLRELFFQQLKVKVHPEKVLTKIKFETLALQVDEFNFTEKKAKLSATVEGMEEFDLSIERAAGLRLIERIRGRILGKDILEAEKYIRNLPEINRVIISSWPFWARTLPELPENVKFQLKR